MIRDEIKLKLLLVPEAAQFTDWHIPLLLSSLLRNTHAE